MVEANLPGENVMTAIAISFTRQANSRHRLLHDLWLAAAHNYVLLFLSTRTDIKMISNHEMLIMRSCFK
jgi:hypothetical protein